MGKITLLDVTNKPISAIGKRAGICWEANIEDETKNYKRGLDCIKSNHGRTLEFVNIEMLIDGYSARVIREWYTHIGGAPTRLQASTRYIDYNNFEYIIPKGLDRIQEDKYIEVMMSIQNNYKELLDLGVTKEDAANILPLGMTTRIVDKRNLRNLIDMSKQRLCNRAYWEYRELFKDICNELKQVDDEWEWIVENCFKPKCIAADGEIKCPESRPCGKMKK